MSEVLGALSAKGHLPTVEGSEEVTCTGVEGSGESGGAAFPSSLPSCISEEPAHPAMMTAKTLCTWVFCVSEDEELASSDKMQPI